MGYKDILGMKRHILLNEKFICPDGFISVFFSNCNFCGSGCSEGARYFFENELDALNLWKLHNFYYWLRMVGKLGIFQV